MTVTSFQLFVLAPIVLACAAYMLWPLLRKNRRSVPQGDAHDPGRALNLSIVRERRAHLDAEIAGLAPDSPERERRIREFTEAAMSDLDTSAHAGGSTDGKHLRKAMALAFGLLVLAGPLVMYRMSGTPEWIEVAANLPQGASGNVDGLVSELERRLKAEPDRADGWLLLGRTRLAMGDLTAAQAAMEKALLVDSEDPALAAAIRADLADVIAQAAGTRLEGRPWALIQQALTRDPRHPKALALAGAYQVTRGDAQAALGHWRLLLTILPAGSEQATQIQSMIADLQSGRLAGSAQSGSAQSGSAQSNTAQSGESTAPVLGQPGVPPSAATGPVLSGRVTLASTLAAGVRPDDTLFVVARAQGPDGRPAGPPLAVRRAKAAALPLAFSLSDADAMMPAARLSTQAKVIIVVRVSRTGTATPAPGDLEGSSGPVASDAQGLEVEIDRMVQ